MQDGFCQMLTLMWSLAQTFSVWMAPEAPPSDDLVPKSRSLVQGAPHERVTYILSAASAAEPPTTVRSINLQKFEEVVDLKNYQAAEQC